jgi:multiple sugar transport system substrate-binding protein
MMIARFTKANPSVHINYQFFPYDVFVRKLQASYRAHNASDMQQMFGTWVTQYAQNGMLDAVPSKYASTIKTRFWPAALGAYGSGGKFYGMPKEFNLENGGMLVNLSMVKTVPKTWQQLVNLGHRLTKMDSKGKLSQAGFAFTNGDSITFLYLAMILQQGASYWAKDGKHVDFSTKAAKQAWIDETSLVTKYKTDNEQSWGTQDSFDVFFRGHAAMAMRGPWVIPVAKDTYPKTIKSIKYCYCTMPSYRGAPKFAAESGWGEVVNARSSAEVKAAAWKFIDFMAQPNNLRDWALKTGTVPAVRSLQNDPRIVRQAPYMKTSFRVLPYGQWVGPVQDRDTFWGDIHTAFTAVELGKQKPLDALADAQKRINSMIDQHLGP